MSMNFGSKETPAESDAVMRVAMYEILYVDDVPDSVAIHEAVELARRYEDEDAVAFVNGLLGSFVRGVQR